MSNTHQHSQCGFAEDLVSYLYGEINSAEKIKFEKHLDKCSTCDEELLSFGYVRSSIIDWREEEFLNLETPKFVIPLLETSKTVETSDNSKVSRSWFDGLRQIFSLSPAWGKATTAFAALAVIVGFTIVLINFSKSSDLAEVNKDQNSNENIIPIEKTSKPASLKVPDEKNNLIEKDQPEPSLADSNSDNNLKPVEKNNSLSEKTVVKIADKTQKTKKQSKDKKPGETLMADKNLGKSKNSSDVNIYKTAPKLSNLSDEDEDDSLRLADLFDEVGSK